MHFSRLQDITLDCYIYCTNDLLAALRSVSVVFCAKLFLLAFRQMLSTLLIFHLVLCILSYFDDVVVD